MALLGVQRQCRGNALFRAIAIGLALFGTSGCAVSTRSLCSQEKAGYGYPCPQLTSTKGIGLIVAEKHIAIGWMQELYLEIPDPKDCRLILIVNSPADIVTVANLLKASGADLAQICAVNDKKVEHE